MRRCLVRTWPVLGGAVAARRHTSSTDTSLPGSPLQSGMEQYLKRYTLKNKHQVFASFLPDQLLLSEMLRYVKEIDAARESVRDANAGRESEARATFEKELDAMTEEQVEDIALQYGVKDIKRPMCGMIPFKPSGDDSVRAHLAERRDVPPYRTRLLCNSGVVGSGKSVLMLHSTAAAIPILERKINKRVTVDPERRWRPLGFYVSFNTCLTATTWRDAETKNILTLIALRIAYSVLEDEQCVRRNYDAFSSEMYQLCSGNDEEDFTCIIKALRTVLKWDGPMFLAIDEFHRAFPGGNTTDIVLGLSTVCARLLDAAPKLPLPLSNVVDINDYIYERYIAASAYSAVYPVTFAAQYCRELLVQPMPTLDLQTIERLVGRDTPAMMAPHYSELFTVARGVPTNEQLLLLIHLTLLSGRPLIVLQFLRKHAKDVPGQFGHPIEALEADSMWLRRDATNVEKPVPIVSEAMCLRACELAVGLAAKNIFVGDDTTRRAFALSLALANDCIVTQVTPTRALVSPLFLDSISYHWPKGGENRNICQHLDKLSESLNKHVDFAMVLVKAGPSLIANPHEEGSRQLVEDWTRTTPVAFVDLTFRALCLRFACVFCTHTPTGKKLLTGAHSQVEQAGFLDCEFVSGPLVLVANIVNFPSMFIDAYRNFDTKSTSNGVNGACKSSYEVLQEALAKGDHFAFQPANPNNQGEDGVIFLRETSEHMCWTVLLIQNEHCWDEYKAETPDQPKKHVLDVWRGKLAHLPAVIRDTTGVKHNLRYVRMLATINPIERQMINAAMCSSDEESLEPNHEVTKRYADCAEKSQQLAAANAAFIELVESSRGRREVENAVCKWAKKNGSVKHLNAEDRATQLLHQIQRHRSRICRNRKKHYSMGSGPMIAEFLIDLDNISKWCPTVGMFVRNVLKIRELMETPTPSSWEPTTSAKNVIPTWTNKAV
ncbi:multi-copy leucine-rich repeat protein, putative [Bodo saltans]|uniref:Multi-copy leucine-rich repeat protein, putative n=1 Tax=Bodo saltans TaxID=75058 RepID=A0A0S4IQD2_BODSA|nr:multi-copy leucine-rich repeat protein, putative [Bodo saltans]|eukprot:CUF95051.1 multi-copy leucine-rich repeat protein, putative [Bodo saltans]